MSALRILLIETGCGDAVTISHALAEAEHFVLEANGFEEATEALSVQKWDAVLLPSSDFTENVARFALRLRELDGKSDSSIKTPLVSVAPADPDAPAPPDFDLILPQPFEPTRFAETVESFTARARADAQPSDDIGRHLPVFEPEQFHEQVGFDRDLAVEIIDLFMDEHKQQIAAMTQALGNNELKQLSCIAHTIKGSLASLRAPRARHSSDQLEMAAKCGDGEACRRILPLLQQDIEELVPELLLIRIPKPAC